MGQTNNLKRRLGDHNNGKDHSSKIGMPWELVYSEIYKTRKESMAREKEIKGKKSRKYVESLIQYRGVEQR